MGVAKSYATRSGAVDERILAAMSDGSAVAKAVYTRKVCKSSVTPLSVSGGRDRCHLGGQIGIG